MHDEDSAQTFRMTIGLYRLAEELGLHLPLPSSRSEIVAGARRTIVTDGKTFEQYPKSYTPQGLIGNLRFALRYEPIALDVYLAIFQTIGNRQLEDWIRSEPTSIFTRRVWYLYELLMGKRLDIPDLIPSGYIDLIDPEIHITGPRRLIRRQRINDNLLGFSGYSPLVRRTEPLNSFMEKRLAQEARVIVEGCDTAILARAVHYLFTKETKSSFAIEGEAPSKDRTERFVAALMKAQPLMPPARTPSLIYKIRLWILVMRKRTGGRSKILYLKHSRTTARMYISYARSREISLS